MDFENNFIFLNKVKDKVKTFFIVALTPFTLEAGKKEFYLSSGPLNPPKSNPPVSSNFFEEYFYSDSVPHRMEYTQTWYIK